MLHPARPCSILHQIGIWTSGDAVDFQRHQRWASQKLEAAFRRFSKRQTCMFFFSIFFPESNSEVPGSEMASHLELRETEPPDVHVADDVDGKYLEQSFRELEVTEELHWINVTRVESSRDVISSRYGHKVWGSSPKIRQSWDLLL